MLYDCILEVNYNSSPPFIKFSTDFPHLEINYWCNSEIDILIIEKFIDDPGEMLVTLQDYFSDAEILSANDADKTLVIKSCLCHLDPLDAILEQNGCLF